MRNKIYQMVHVYDSSTLSVVYKWFMILIIMASLVPLTSKEPNALFGITDRVCLVIYIIDYALRWLTADYKFHKEGRYPFLRYPFRLISIIDILSIAAIVMPMFSWFKYTELAGVLKVLRVVRIFRYSKSMQRIIDILRRSKKPLMAVGSLALGYILISALVMFNVEPQSFETFFDAVYWSTILLTTVGYGDICPVSQIGKSVAMLSSFLGIAIVALPAGIIAAEYMETLNKKRKR